MSSETIIFDKMKEIVYNENRPFSYKDFESFPLNGQTFKYSKGHIRNTFSRLHRNKIIEKVYRTNQTFYTIRGVKVGNSVTPTYITATPILTFEQRQHLNDLKIHKIYNPAIHDIRLYFVCEGLRSLLLLSNSELLSNIDKLHNKDIILKDITLDDITLKVTVHNTDTVTVMLACSDTPIPMDFFGISKLSSALTRVEERLQRIIDDYNKSTLNKEFDKGTSNMNTNTDIQIPYHMKWKVTMWHYGHDSELRLSGKTYEITWEQGLEVFRIYSKKRIKPKSLQE
jgi:hypothetical protein